MVTIHSINLVSPEDEMNSQSLMVEGGQDLYMSENNIYLSYTEYINEYDIQTKIMMELLESKLSDSDKAVIEKIKATDNDVLSQYEKESKILQVYYECMNYLPSEEQDQLSEQMDSELESRLEEYEYMEYTIITGCRWIRVR
jgi:uncharacterized secreted protein with C-terminal beta-propeller domain